MSMDFSRPIRFKSGKNSGPQLSPSCRLDGVRRWSAQQHLMGLTFDGGVILLDDGFFVCCGGNGLEFVLEGSATGVAESATDAQRVACRRCGLTERFFWISELSRLMAGGMSISQIPFALGLDPMVDASKQNLRTQVNPQADYVRRSVDRWRRIHSGAMASGPRGRLSVDSQALSLGDAKTPISDIWAGLASVIWHDGVRPLIHVHGKGVVPITRWTKQLQIDGQHSFRQRSIIVIEGLQRLWEPNYLEEMEQVIYFANRTETPLWLFSKRDALREGGANGPDSQGDEHAKSAGRTSTKFRANLDKKMDFYRRGPLEKWLSPATLDRLKDVCDLPVITK
ncbi:MAG: hypothetical protein NTV34_06385 [Proteobacteria bacterium]|nr:hypothetical protein [Pseudomonadota bacterium]